MIIISNHCTRRRFNRPLEPIKLQACSKNQKKEDLVPEIREKGRNKIYEI
jgi:hypothetical protein